MCDTTCGGHRWVRLPIMSNQNWPPPPNQGNNPWASQDPNWRPQQFQEAAQRDPRTPFGQQPTPPPSWEDLTPPPQRKGPYLWVALGAVVVIAAIAVAILVFGPDPAPVATASPDQAATASQPAPSPQRTGNFIPFEGNGNGIFEVVSYTWVNDSQLEARIRVEVEEPGDFGFAVFAFTNDTRLSYEPQAPDGFFASKDNPYEGDVTFLMPRTDATIMLTTSSGRISLNALPIKG